MKIDDDTNDNVDDEEDDDNDDDLRYYIEGELGGANIKPLVHIVETTM